MSNYVTSNVSITGSKKEVKRLMGDVSSDEELFDLDKIAPIPKELDVVWYSMSPNALYLYISMNRDKLSDERILKVLKAQKETEDGVDEIPSIDNLTPDRYIAGEAYRILPNAAKEKNPEDTEYLISSDYGYPKDKADYLAYGKIIFENYEKYGCASWHKWVIQNWGTKGNTECVECHIEKDRNGIMTVGYCMNTEWRAPIPVFQKLSKTYGVEVKVDYATEGCFGHNCGRVICRGEDTIFEDHEGDETFSAEILGFSEDY